MRINLFAGPGCGKSVAALGLTVIMEKLGYKVQYVNEYIKSWAYENRKPVCLDQLYITHKQLHYEHAVFKGGYDHLVTDSPILLGSIYADFYGDDPSVGEVLRLSAKIFEKRAESIAVVLERNDDWYNSMGRFQTLEQAKIIDRYIEDKVNNFYTKDRIIRFNPKQPIDQLYEAIKFYL